MNSSRLRLCVLSSLFFAGCAHPPTALKPAPQDAEMEPDNSPPPPRVLPEPSYEMPKLAHYCLGRAMSASMLVMSGTPHEEAMKVYFKNYYEAFLDAKEQQKYVSCLEEGRSSPDYGKSHDEAVKWLKRSQGEAAKYETYFPAEKRIADVEETYTDVSDKLVARRVAITLKDGTRTVEETRFDKTAP